MTRVLFVCHGNICRSPMAEFILKDMVKNQGLENEFYISSCATSTEEIWGDRGNPVYPPAKEELAKYGISCDGKYAVQLKKGDYNKYDLLVCMDSNNVRNAMTILGADPKNKVKKLMDFTSRKGDVADPWYSRKFDIAYQDIFDGCKGILESIL